MNEKQPTKFDMMREMYELAMKRIAEFVGPPEPIDQALAEYKAGKYFENL